MSRVFDGSQTGANETNLVTPASGVYNSLAAWTFAAWVYPTANIYGVILVKDATGSYSTFFDVPSLALSASANLQGGLLADSTSNESLLLNTWSHIAATYNSAGDGKIRLYINGIESTYVIQDANVGVPLDDSAAGYWFGNDTFDDGFTGRIAEIAIWNTPLTGGQVATLAASTTGVAAIQPANLVGYWHLCGTASPEPDATANGNNAALSANPPTQGPDSPGFTCVGPPPVLPWSSTDSRNFGHFPNSSRTVNQTKIYDVQTSSNPAVPGKDSRTTGAPVDCRIAPNIPENSRTPGTFGPGE